MKKNYLKVIVMVGLFAVTTSVNAQIELTKTLPPVGTTYCQMVNYINDLFIRNNPPQGGLDQTWDYSMYSLSTFSNNVNYEVIPSESISPTSLSAIPSANFFIKNVNNSNSTTTYWLYEDSNDSLRIRATEQNGELQEFTHPYLDFKFNVPYLSNVTWGTSSVEYNYAGTGTLKLGELTFSNVALFKQVVEPGNTIIYQFFQVSPFYHRIAMMIYDSSPYITINAYIPKCELGATNSIDEHIISNISSIYPNPTNSVLNISAKTNTNIKIVTVLGTVVSTQQLHAGSNTIDVSNLENGVYFIQNENGGAVKFVKE